MTKPDIMLTYLMQLLKERDWTVDFDENKMIERANKFTKATIAWEKQDD